MSAALFQSSPVTKDGRYGASMTPNDLYSVSILARH